MNAVSLAGTKRTREAAGRTSGVGHRDITPILLRKPDLREPGAVDIAHTTSRHESLPGRGILMRHSCPVKGQTDAGRTSPKWCRGPT
jgi:hypothetical protein